MSSVLCDMSIICTQDGTKVLTASCDKTCKLWDLQSNQAINIGVVSSCTCFVVNFHLVLIHKA